MSADKIISAIQSAHANPLTNGFYWVQANDDLQLLHKMLNGTNQL